jgi:aldose sugar dehydrogenase
MGPDNYLYAIIGDLNHRGKLQNIENVPDPDDTSVIFRIDPNNGSAATNNPFANIDNDALKRYYAYGIRNSFGIAFDPVNGNLWDTENGSEVYDDINLVKPGFNSGWKLIMSPIPRSGIFQDQLINLPGSSYHDYILSWQNPVAITAIELFKSTKLRKIQR